MIEPAIECLRFRRMDQQVYDRGSLTASVDSTQDLTEEEVETYALLDGFVLRTAQIDQQQRNLEHADYQYSKKIEEEVAKRRFDERGQPARDVGRQIAEKGKFWLIRDYVLRNVIIIVQ